jgi:hypothetical protein
MTVQLTTHSVHGGAMTAQQRRTGGFPATRTAQPMPLIFSDDRLNLGQFPDLMPRRASIIAREDRTATPTLFRFKRKDFLAFLRGNQRSFVSGMSALSTTFFRFCAK